MFGGGLLSWQSDLSGLFEAAGEVWRWSLDRIRPTLPQPLRVLGWHDQAGVFRVTDDASLEPVGIRQTSWLGETRLVPANNDVCRAQPRHVLVLPDTQQFRTRVLLSPMVARRGRTALELRHDRFMPLAEAQGCFAYEADSEVQDGRLSVDIAVVRAAQLGELAAQQPDRTGLEIAGALSPEGRSRFVLARHGMSGLANWLKPLAIYVLTIIALLAWQDRWQDHADSEAEVQAQQVLAVRNLRDRAAELDAVEARRAIDGRPVYLGEILQTLSGLPEYLAGSDRLQRIRLDGTGQLDLVISRGEGDRLETGSRRVPIEGAQP